ncbi:MAG: DUF3500 domain-containing protein [Gemmatimonadota bacterium]
MRTSFFSRPPSLVVAVFAIGVGFGTPGTSAGQQNNLDDPFFGIITNGARIEGLFPVRATGVSTAPVVAAARAYLASLTPLQVERTRFGLDSDEWRHWSNIPLANLPREGLPFRDMTEPQREAALNLLRAGLSARAFNEAQKIRQIDGWLAVFNDDPVGFGEDAYFISIFGEPSATEPWGWQLDGHHLVVNYFAMGDQVVMSPQFWGAEPVYITEGELAGMSVLQEEQDSGLAFMESLRPDQRRTALIRSEKTGNNALAQAFRDNLVLDYAGIRATELDAAQREGLMEVVAVYAGHMEEGHARVRVEEVRAHLDDTYFAWIGDVGPDAVYYYRIQSPVVLIEFDHTTHVSLRNVMPPGPSRNHFHITVRTPNGNDYGKDLLRQHYEMTENDSNHQHAPAP